jgi:hypothetical protein
MKRLLMAATASVALLSAPALADSITLTATCDGVTCGLASSASGTLDIADQAFGSVFNLNSLSINSAQFLAPPDVLNTNTLDVAQNATGAHTLVLDIVASNLTGPNAVTSFLTSFSVTGQTAGWSIQEQSLINGIPLNTSPLFTGIDGSGNSTDPAFAGSLFNVEAIYTINSIGSGSVNGGIDVSVAAVPEPATWGMMLLGFVGLAWAFRSRRRSASLPAAA